MALEDCYADFCRRTRTPESEAAYVAFEAGWRSCAQQINNGVDSDLLQAELYEAGFLLEDEDATC